MTSQFTRRTALRYGAAAITTGLSASTLSRLVMAGPVAAPVAEAPTKEAPYADAMLVDGPPPKPAADSFTIAVLPDTQKYTYTHPDGFYAQTRWLAEHKKDYNIACVLHLGDVTDHNVESEWEVAVKALGQLDGRLPYFTALGNHDYGLNGRCQDRSTMYGDYFPVGKLREGSHFGGVYDKEPDRADNCYHLFSAGGRDFIVITLEFGPRNDVVRWANEVAASHGDRAAILTTHAYMYYDDTRYDWSTKGKDQTWNPHSYQVALSSDDDVNDGEQLWQKLVNNQPNFVLTLNGHVLQDGLGRMVSKSKAGHEIPQLLVNFQMRPNGGDGWLRLMEFKADGHTVDVVDYSPTLDQCNEAPENRFTMRVG